MSFKTGYFRKEGVLTSDYEINLKDGDPHFPQEDKKISIHKGINMITLDIGTIRKKKNNIMFLKWMVVEGTPPEMALKKEYDGGVKFDSVYFPSFIKGVSEIGFVQGRAEIKKDGKISFY